ncbi:Sm-like protein LSM1B [Linum grandiflorum]
MSWAGPEDVYLSTSLASYLDKKLLVLLRDGRKLMGILRSFDQFGTESRKGSFGFEGDDAEENGVPRSRLASRSNSSSNRGAQHNSLRTS